MKASILFITYKHEGYVAEAIRSAMAQDHPDLELVVCDDGSPDRTVEILENELARCPPHISVVRSYACKNLGFRENFTRGLASCTGEVVVAMSGDDISAPSRVSRICGVFSANPDCMLVCSNWTRIDDKGRDLGIHAKFRQDAVFSYANGLNHLYAGAPVCGATGAYRTALRDRFPPMEAGSHAEDNCFWVRALLTGTIHYLAESLVLWRSHDNNQSNWSRHGDNPAARKRHLRFLLAHQCMWRQWMRDFDHASAAGLLAPDRRARLERTMWINQESYRLLRLSIKPGPWKLWLLSALRILRLCGWTGEGCWWFNKIRCRHFRLRLYPSKRENFWRRHFSKLN